MSLYKHILCATNFSEASNKALRQAIELHMTNRTKLTVLHCIEPVVLASYALDYVQSNHELIDDAKEQLHESLKEYQLADIETVIETERAKITIPKLVKELGVDLVVVGRHGHHGLIENMIGSTTHYLLNHLPCNVLIAQE
jgi:universal stress protein A